MPSPALITAPAAAPVTATLFGPVEDDLRAVEERLARETQSDIGAVRDISGHTLLSGGKRLRPALALLCARLVGRVFPADRAYAAAAAAEMIHMATLMHDDVVDESNERRGRPTANAVFGNAITVLTGDFLLAKSISMLAHSDDNLEIVRVFSDVTVAMAEGEVLQAAVAHDAGIGMETYEAVIERKTARFLAGCCETGALVGGANRAEAAALRVFGHHLGMAFQIADDLLDLCGDPAKTGKPRGTDLRDGRVTLPLLHTLQVGDTETTTRLRAIIERRGSITEAEITTVTNLVAASDGFEAAREIAGERIALALDALPSFPPSPFRDSLDGLARFVIARDR